MSEPVHVGSIDAIESFRAALVEFLKEARTALESVEAEVRRTQTWLDGDCRSKWTRQFKESVKKLDQAEEELYSANLSDPRGSHAFQKMAVTKARRRVVEAEEKLLVVKRWRQSFENRSSPLVRQLDPMIQLVTRKLPMGVHDLSEMVKALQAYAETTTPKPPASGGDRP